MKILVVIAIALSAMFAGRAWAYDAKCEPWGNNEARCLVSKKTQEPGVSANLQITATQAVTFTSTGWFSACGVPGKRQYEQSYTVTTGQTTPLLYTLNTDGANGCFEIFLTQCKSGSTTVDCYKSFTYAWP